MNQKITLNRRGVAGALTAQSHISLDQLVHRIFENSYFERIRSGIKLVSDIWWSDATRILKIREVLYTYTGNRITVQVTKQYNSSGNVIETYTETISRDTVGRILNITGVFT